MRHQPEILEHHADAATEAGQALAGQRHHILPEQADDAPAGPLGEVEQLQQRRLARARRAGQEIETAAGERKAYVGQRLAIQTIAQADICELADGRQASISSPAHTLIPRPYSNGPAARRAESPSDAYHTCSRHSP